MSDDLHPDLEEFYDTAIGDDDQWVDEPEDDDDGYAIRTRGNGRGGSYQVFIDPDDLEDDDEDDDDADYIFEDDIGETYEDDDDDIENENDGSAEAFIELDNLIRTNGTGFNNISSNTTSRRQEVVEEDEEEEDEDEDENLDVESILQQLMSSGGVRLTSGLTNSNLLRAIQQQISGRSGGSAGATGNESSAPKRRTPKGPWWKPHTKPDPTGKQLLNSGEFGRVGKWQSKLPKRSLTETEVEEEEPIKNPVRRPKANTRWMNGWSGPKITSPHSHAIVPNTPGTIVASYPSVPYVGQFAREDYSLFYTATQYFTLHLYSMNQSRKNHIQSNPNKRRRQSRSRSRSVLSPVATRSRTEEIAEEEENEDDYETEDEDEDFEDDDDDDDDDAAYIWGGMNGRSGPVSEDTSLKRIKRVQGIEGSWTVTDCDADRKGEKMIYSSITPYVHMLYTAESDQEHIELDFTGSRNPSMWGHERFGIWSIRFSADGKEVVAGASGGKILVYDIDAQRRTLAVRGHCDDVNAVSFADESSTNILVSGSDDGYVKIWDRRSLSSSTPSGILVGATEGITYTSPKGDGRYIIVNSKDQAARLYDLRKMAPSNLFDNEPDAVAKYGQPRFDYRSMQYPRPRMLAHPKDCSIMTFRGHSVLRTLIRCHFSPRESTGQSYIYSGSADGLIHIWSLDGRVVQVLNRAESLPLKQNGVYSDPSISDPIINSTSSRGNQSYETYGMGYTVRDVAWHGYEPTLMSTCWETNGHYRRGGNVAKHEWKGLGKGGLNRLEDWVEKKKSEQPGNGAEEMFNRRRQMPGALFNSMSDWDM
ncbi:uncharacterized protein L201_005151 [Kwoniella dendrophila CBS 6074]|uniref:WD40 repeat-like protein n=1 Tax=Kwoniella dendrophila CBS 6074 TaxID=1295534 RepID=A0AAX4JZB9_9TREE